MLMPLVRTGIPSTDKLGFGGSGLTYLGDYIPHSGFLIRSYDAVFVLTA